MHLFTHSYFCTLVTFLLSVQLHALTNSNRIPSTLLAVPVDSILVMSFNGEKVISKSGILKSPSWKPLLDRFTNGNSSLRNWLSDGNISGIEWKEPVQFFVRLIEGEQPKPQFGAIFRISDAKQADQTLAEVANWLGLRASKKNSKVYQRTTQPFALGRAGDFCFVIGILSNSPYPQDLEIIANFESFVTSLEKKNLPEMPAPLSKYAAFSSDLSLYIEGSGCARILESGQNPSITALSNILPIFDPFLQHSLGIFIDSSQGYINLNLRNHSSETENPQRDVPQLSIIEQLPGDAPIVARISIPEKKFQETLVGGADILLKFFSSNKLNADIPLPGFDLSARELLSFPTGDFVFAGGHARVKKTFGSGGQPRVQSIPSFFSGMKIRNSFAFKELMSGVKQGMSISSLLGITGLNFIEHPESVWLTTTDYQREIELNKPIQPLSFNRRKLLLNHSFALDFIPSKTAASLRKTRELNFDLLKRISWLDEVSNLSLKLDEQNILHGKIKLTKADEHGWETLAKHLAQEWIDKINERLFMAISQDDLSAVIESVALGAMINANDRFGHSPIHYAAYRGNAYIMDYLLQNGGDPNSRGKNLSTPLHSAAWGKNQDIVELLLEDGAEVDALTSEKESPIMTATLRGQVDTVETLLALSANPHATDSYGSNLMDLAAASGKIELVEIFQNLGVKCSNPLHLAAGTGDFKRVEELLGSGISINQQDSFGATPLLIATVAGREDMVDFLLNRSADPKIDAKAGYSLLHGAAFSGKKSLVRKMLAFGLEINQRFGPDQITPTDVGEEGSEGVIYLRSMGGRSAWELGPE